ncbi:retrovirus-related Pol polyprotein from transposon 297 [Trichonephila clavipes]|nr:retrovirus-related Pol polyprotein from transposon 297 [Trichonephila clavipes]
MRNPLLRGHVGYLCLKKREVEKQIDEWLEQGIIRESCSDFSSPVVVCKKKDGTMRLCIDYRKLNKKIVKDRYPLPIIEEVLDKLGNGKIFTTLDLKNAFFHVDVDEASRKYTAFVTETGQYEFLKVPFGLSISSNYFQRYINYVFRELLRDGTLIIYLDDIIIPATDEKEACKKLARVLETASRYGIELNLKKCQFLQGKINFLGHVIQNGIFNLRRKRQCQFVTFRSLKMRRMCKVSLG